MALMVPPSYSSVSENNPTIPLPNNWTEKNEYIPYQQEMENTIHTPKSDSRVYNASVRRQPQLTNAVRVNYSNYKWWDELTPSACCTLSIFFLKFKKGTVLFTYDVKHLKHSAFLEFIQ